MNKRFAVWLALALLGGGLAASPAMADPPPWAPAHGYRAKQYRYVYYPSYEVYYAPETRLWFWLDGGRWRFGATLPGDMAVMGVPGVSIMLGSERPYYEHSAVIAHYGRGDRYRDEHYRDERGGHDERGDRHGHGDHDGRHGGGSDRGGHDDHDRGSRHHDREDR